MKFEVDVKGFLKVIKNYKIDNSLYFTVEKEKIKIKNLDFKQGLGVLQGQIKQIQTNCDSLIKFKVESEDLINKLENFKQGTVYFFINGSILTMKNEDSSLEYKIGCDTSGRSVRYCDIQIIQDFTPNISFLLQATDCVKYFKLVSTVDKLLLFRFFSENKNLIQLVSKKITSIGTQEIKDPLEFKLDLDDTIKEHEVYYSDGIISNFFKEKSLIKFQFDDQYLVISRVDPLLSDFRIYLPLK